MTRLTPSNGHHMDDLLIPYPYALLSSAVAFDIGARLSGRTAWSQTASKLAATGLGTAMAAGLPGFAREFSSLPEEPALRRGAAAHMICNISSLACFAAARSRRHDDGYMPTSGLFLELVGAGLLALGGLHKERQEAALEERQETAMMVHGGAQGPGARLPQEA